MIIVVWRLTGALFDFSNTWQLSVNAGTFIITILMVFLIQSHNNTEIHLKLDELLLVIENAHDDIIDIEDKKDIGERRTNRNQ
jgi:low affinity Fe/Cu permease